MTTYYVRKTGSDAAAGTSAGAAWLTVDKAANTVAAGDTVYIGAGTYAELVTMDTSGTSGNIISFIGDVDGSQTGDAGIVLIQGFPDPEDTTSFYTGCIFINGKEFLTFKRLNMLGRLGIYDSGALGDRSYEEVTIEECVINGTQKAIDIDLNLGATPTTAGLTIRDCITSVIYITHQNNASANVDVKMTIENVVVCGFLSNEATYCLVFYNTVSSTFSIGGVDINNVTCLGNQYGIGFGRFKNTTHVSVAANCVGSNRTAVVANISGTTAAVDTYNTMQLCGSNATSGVTTTGSTFESAAFLGGIGDFLLHSMYGWSPFKPFEPLSFAGFTSPLIDNGNATYAPSGDIYGNTRPMGTADDIGAVEARARPSRSATWAADGSTYSMAFASIGYYESMIPVDASSTTVTVVAYKDASYTGTAPKLEVLIGDTSQGTDSMVVAVEVEETLSVNFTPSAAGWARVRLYSYATAGTVFFDSLAVT